MNSIKYYYSKILKKIRGISVKNSQIHTTSKVESGTQFINSSMDKYSFCGYDCDINFCDIGSFVSIANSVVIGGGMHPIDWVGTSPVFYEGRDSIKAKFSEYMRDPLKKTIIGHDVWIAQNVIIKQGINIGIGSVIGMGSIVTKDVDPYTIVGGNPAKVIRSRFNETITKGLLDSKWWEFDDEKLYKYSKYFQEPNVFLKELHTEKILIQYNYILHYRKPFFNELSKYYDVTVLHSGEASVTPNDKYKEIIVPVKRIGPFYLQKNVIKEVRSNNYDIVIALFDVRWINTVLSVCFNKNSKFIWWGAWITKSKIANSIRLFFTKKSYSSVFYTNEAKKDFINYGISEDNLYVANNTFDVEHRIKSYEHEVKNTILFVGSLNKRKQNNILLKSFNNIIDKIPKDIKVIIIGDGKEGKYLKNLVTELGIDERVCFKREINDAEGLKKYYSEAIVSVSFGQAGLSVLQSLGFGVPFLTKKNAISGGEKYNIKHNMNSVFCEDDQKSLEEMLVYLCNNIEFSRKLGQNAYEYYSKYCTIENMVQGFRDSIEGTKLASIDDNNYEV